MPGSIESGVFKIKLTEAGDYALRISGEKHEYSEEDLINATLIFTEVVNNLMFDHLSKTIRIEGMTILAEEFGKNMRQTIQLATGLDMHEVVKNNLVEKEVCPTSQTSTKSVPTVK